MLEGEARLLVAAANQRGKTYERFLIHVPSKIAKDSQFPFKPNQALNIDVDPTSMAIVLSETNNPEPAPRRRKKG